VSNFFYNPSGNPGTSSPGASLPIRGEFAAISAAFDLFPALAGNGGKALVVNGPGTTISLTAGKLALGGDLTFIGTGATVFSAVANTTLTLPLASGTLLTTNGRTMAGILNLVNGSSIPTAVAGTNNTQIASTAFVTGAVATAVGNATGYANANFLPLTGGSLSGPLSVGGALSVTGNVGVTGNVYATATVTGNNVTAWTPGGLGYTGLQRADTSHTGYIEFYRPSGARAGYIGFGYEATGRLVMVGNENGYTGFDMFGSVSVSGAFNANGMASNNSMLVTANGGNDAVYYANSAPGHNRGIQAQTNGVIRWYLTVANGNPETGGDNGSDFALYRYHDNGSYFDQIFSINRANGQANFLANMNIGGEMHSNSIMVATGEIFVANNYLYWLGRHPTTGHWVIVDNNVTRFDMDQAGNLTMGGWIRVVGGDNGVMCNQDQSYLTLNGNSSFGAGGSIILCGSNRAVRAGGLYVEFYEGTSRRAWLINNGDPAFVTLTRAFKPGGGSWEDASDGRAKTVLGNYDRGLDEILKLNPIRYRFKGNMMAPSMGIEKDSYDTTKEYNGFDARDVAEIMPEMTQKTTGFIDDEEVDDLLTMDLTALPLAIVNAIKTLHARVKHLEDRKH